MRYEDLRLEPDSHGLPCRLAWPLPCNGIRDLQVLCLPLLQRPGGFMVCVPEVIHASILADLQGPEPLDAVGPYRLESLETIDEDEAGEEHLTGIQCPALLVDLDESMLARMEPFDPVTDITVTSFMEGAPQLVPSGELLMLAARRWIEGEAGDRLAFYTAGEGVEEPDEIPPKGPPAKRGATAAAKKRVTVNQLAEQVTALAGLLPGLVDQVKSVVDRQNALELASLPGPSPAAAPAAEVAAHFPQPCAAAAAPHAGHVGQPKALGALAKVLPTPAKVPGALPLQPLLLRCRRRSSRPRAPPCQPRPLQRL